MIFGIKIADLIVGIIVIALIVFAVVLKVKHKNSCCKSCTSCSCCDKKHHNKVDS